MTLAPVSDMQVWLYGVCDTDIRLLRPWLYAPELGVSERGWPRLCEFVCVARDMPTAIRTVQAVAPPAIMALLRVQYDESSVQSYHTCAPQE